MLGVTETWMNADGTVGNASVSDNVEAYAPGSPIIAWSGDDTLTGAGANDVFVFAQPIANDIIYNFNVGSDKIDLAGFANIASFGDIQGHIVENGNGDAVITIAQGETITLHDVNAAALTAADFMFNQTAFVENNGIMSVSDGAVLPLSGTVDNTGTIALNSTGDQTELQIVGDGLTLEGGGQITLSDNAANIIVGTNLGDVLANVDNTIAGVGQIGLGDGDLTLLNQAHGTIEANVAGGALIIDTGNAIENYGVLEATNGGVLRVEDSVHGGSAFIAGGTVEFGATSDVAVTFDNGASGTVYGVLMLDDPSQFTGSIAGFTGTGPASSDTIDVTGLNFDSGHFSDAYDAATGVLTLSDGTNNDLLTFVGFAGNASNFDFAADAAGTGTLITDPPATDVVTGEISLTGAAPSDQLTASVTAEGTNYSGHFDLGPVSEGNSGTTVEFDFTNDQINIASGQTITQSYDIAVADAQSPAANQNLTASVSIGGPGNDNFVFAPGIGADTIANFNPQHDSIELDHFANAQTVQELQSLVTNDGHGDAVINLGHHDSITVAGVTAPELQQIIQAGHVLLH